MKHEMNAFLSSHMTCETTLILQFRWFTRTDGLHRAFLHVPQLDIYKTIYHLTLRLKDLCKTGSKNANRWVHIEMDECYGLLFSKYYENWWCWIFRAFHDRRWDSGLELHIQEYYTLLDISKYDEIKTNPFLQDKCFTYDEKY